MLASHMMTTIVIVGSMPEQDAGRKLARKLEPIQLKVFRSDARETIARFKMKGFECWEEAS